jgi:hypothetical protein
MVRMMWRVLLRWSRCVEEFGDTTFEVAAKVAAD